MRRFTVPFTKSRIKLPALTFTLRNHINFTFSFTLTSCTNFTLSFKPRSR